MPPKKRAPEAPEKKMVIPQHLVDAWNATMQDVQSVTDSEEESVQDTQQPWPPPKKRKTHQCYHV